MMDIYKEIREKAKERFQSAYAKHVSLTNKYDTKKINLFLWTSGNSE